MQASLKLLGFGLLFLGSFVFLETNTWACNRCYEDARSAVYSYTAVKKAQTDPENFEFLVFKINGVLTEPLLKNLTLYLKKRPDADPDTVKISTHQNSMGFLHKKTVPLENLVKNLHQAFPQLKFQFIPYPK